MAGCDVQDDHVGERESEGEAAEEGQHDSLARGAEDGLADEVKDGSVGGDAQEEWRAGGDGGDGGSGFERRCDQRPR